MAELIRRADENVSEQPRPCGDCSFCCWVMPITELQKPAHSWCRHFAEGAGCSIHVMRPAVCRDFQCMWTFAVVLDDRWRPDNCRFMMRPGLGGEVVIDVDPAVPDAWKRDPFFDQIRAWSARRDPPHRLVLVRTGDQMSVIFPEGQVDLGRERPDVPIESGYAARKGQLEPYAYYVRDGVPLPLL